MARLLIIEDCADIRELYLELFPDHEIVFALERAQIELLIDRVDLIVCDYHFSPLLSFEEVKAINNNRKPLILCSSDEAKVKEHGGILKMNTFRALNPRILELLQA